MSPDRRAPVLEVEGLTVSFPSPEGPVPAVNGAGFSVSEEEVVGVVGESGAGKSVMMLAIMGLLPRTATVTGSVRYRGEELLGLRPSRLRHYRGNKLAMIFQDPNTSLNPVMTIGSQITEAIRAHGEVSGRAAMARAEELLDALGVNDAGHRAHQHPHELSGGMRQRAMIAMAICNGPAVIIADEPTASLDVTVQAEILAALQRARELVSTAVVLVTHDLGVVAGMADRVLVMHAGRVAETGPVDEVLLHPSHPYTQGLIRSLPSADPTGEGPAGVVVAGPPILVVRNLVKHFPLRAKSWAHRRHTKVHVHAVCDVSLELRAGETLGLVGESGSGKSTLVRCILRLEEATAGTVELGGTDLSAQPRRELRRLRSQLQIVFQNPYSSLDPRMTVAGIVEEPFRIHGRGGDAAREAAELLRLVGLGPDHADRYPHELSGGQRQRIAIARALAVDPKVLLLDEPVSSVDVSLRAGVVKLLEELQERLGVAYVFVTHDLSVAGQLCHRVAVMYLGKIVETGTRDDIYRRPSHPYTQALLSAVPVPDPRIERGRRRIVLQGDVPSAVHPPSGCRFRSRCWKAQDICAQEEPALVERGQGHPVACHFAEEESPLAISSDRS